MPAPHSFTLAQLQTLPVSRHQACSVRSWCSPPPSPPWPWILAAWLPQLDLPPTSPLTPLLTCTPGPPGPVPYMVQPTIPMPYQPYTPLPSGYTHYHYPTPAAYPPTHPRLTTSLSTAPPCPWVTVSSSTKLHHSQTTLLNRDTLNNLSGVRCGLEFFF